MEGTTKRVPTIVAPDGAIFARDGRRYDCLAAPPRAADADVPSAAPRWSLVEMRRILRIS